MKKTIISILTILLLCTGTLLNVNATNDNQEAANSLDSFHNNLLNIQYVNYFESQNEDVTNRINNISNYAGAWIDENDKAHVAFTEQIPKNILQEADRYDIIIDYVHNTKKELIEFQNSLNNLFEEFDLYSIGISEKDNMLLIKYKNSSVLSKLQERVKKSTKI